MSTAREILKKSLTTQSTTGCGGGCSYVFNQTDGCYHLQRSTCQTPCSCPPLICGLVASVLQIVYPESVQQLAPVGLPCLASPVLEGEEASALVLCELFREQAAAVRFWKRLSLGLALASALLLAGLVVVALTR